MEEIPRNKSDSRRAFTRLDLLAVVAVIFVFAAMAASAAGHHRRGADRAVCLDNLRQLMTAWQNYADDHNGQLPFNNGFGIDGPANPTFNNYGGNWVFGIEDFNNGNSDNTNTTYLTDPKWSQLANYLPGTNKALFYRCPGDQSRVASGPRVRSYSMNGCVGEGYDPPPGPSYPNSTVIHFPAPYNSSQAAILTYKRATDIPRPADIMVLVEENAYEINDSCFFVNEDLAVYLQLDDVPAARHDQGASFSFADGHAVVHAWQGSTIISAENNSNVGTQPRLPTTGDMTDGWWLAQHGWEP